MKIPTINTKQDHLIHILLLAAFFILLLISDSQELVSKPSAVIALACIYVIVNTAVDIQAKMFYVDQFLSYSTIALFATAIILSF